MISPDFSGEMLPKTSSNAENAVVLSASDKDARRISRESEPRTVDRLGSVPLLGITDSPGSRRSLLANHPREPDGLCEIEEGAEVDECLPASGARLRWASKQRQTRLLPADAVASASAQNANIAARPRKLPTRRSRRPFAGKPSRWRK
jgi:hypothetical protein